MTLFLLACADPQLEPYSDALTAYERGRAALESGSPAQAVEAFAAAREKDPRSVPLRLWEAKALADAGRLADADARLGELLQADPSVATAWYNRAAYRVRAGRVEEGATDLKRALELGARSPLEAADDPDFAAARTSPAFAGVLPAQPLEASARGPDGAVFIGSRVPIELTVASLPNVAPTLARAGEDPRCLSVTRVLQDDHPEKGSVTRQITLELRGEGPCVANVGPFSVAAGSARAELAAVPVTVEAPPGSAAPATMAPLPTAWPVPSAFAPQDAGFAAARFTDGVVAMGRPDRPITGNGARPDVVVEWRVDGQTRALGGWWRSAGAVELKAEGWEAKVE